jgi:hypothetical protein
MGRLRKFAVESGSARTGRQRISKSGHYLPFGEQGILPLEQLHYSESRGCQCSPRAAKG